MDANIEAEMDANIEAESFLRAAATITKYIVNVPYYRTRYEARRDGYVSALQSIIAAANSVGGAAATVLEQFAPPPPPDTIHNHYATPAQISPPSAPSPIGPATC